jgi:lyso-ornithine lipid O-acyltransferase
MATSPPPRTPEPTPSAEPVAGLADAGARLPNSPAGNLRVTARSVGFVGLTFSLLACLDADLRVHANAHAHAITHKWMGRYGKALLRLYGLEVTRTGALPGQRVDRAAGDRSGAGACGLYPGRDARGKGRMFVMNHRSMLDIFVNLAFVEANTVSRADLSRWPVIGVAARKVGTLFVDRASKQSGAAVISAMGEALEQGRGVLVYPEGTTFPGDEVRPFRPGAFLAAVRAGAEVIPLGIAYGGAGTAYVDEPFAAHYRRVSGVPVTQIGLAFGEPIEVSEGADVEALRALAQARVQALVYEARAAIGEGPSAIR